ncbi:MAG: hypothetical protein ACJA2N_001445 [Salibacteraceae bacterium]|jgi:hypothetical protein
MKTPFNKILTSKNTFIMSVVCVLLSSLLEAQTPSIDVNGDGTLNVLVIGTTNSIKDNAEPFSPNQISMELQSILSADTALSLSINVVAEDIYKTKNVSSGIAGQFNSNLDYYCHSLLQYYYWPDAHDDRMNNLTGDHGVDWDYVVIGADPYIVSNIPGYYSLGVNKIASKVAAGGAIPLLLMMWPKDTALIEHFEEFTYRSADGAKVQLQNIPAGLAWKILPNTLKDTASVHPTPNGSYLAAASIYAHLFTKSASSSQYVYDDSIANIAHSTLINEASQIHYSGNRTFISPYKSCEISANNLIYNHGGTSTENGILTGLQWIVTEAQKTLQYSANPPIHFNYGRSSMGSTHLYTIDPSMFDFSFGYPLQDDKSTGEVSMVYGLDKRVSESDVETDLGVALHMVRQSELPYGRNVPLRTLIAQMLEEIPGVDIYSDNWHLSSDVNKAIGSYMYTILTSDCAFDCAVEPVDPILWRTWMAHKIGYETAWNLMHMEGVTPCFNVYIDTVSSCDSYTWVNGKTYTTSNSTAKYKLTSSIGCDSVVMLNLTLNTVNTSVTHQGLFLTADQTSASYQWLNCPSMIEIGGATSQSYIPKVSGDYAVIVSKNGCSDTSMCYGVVHVGIIENDFGSELLVYPNPTDGNVSIDLGNTYASVLVNLLDLNGKVIQSKTYNNSQILSVQIEHPAGVYLLVIESGNRKSAIQLVKK